MMDKWSKFCVICLFLSSTVLSYVIGFWQGHKSSVAYFRDNIEKEVDKLIERKFGKIKEE